MAIVLALGGCAQLQAIGTAVKLGTASVTNPITPVREAQIEAGFDAAVQLLLVYRRNCIAGRADVHCKQNIRMIQPYTIRAQALLPQLRRFSDQNDQINAVVVFNQLSALYADMQSTAAQVGVNVGALP